MNWPTLLRRKQAYITPIPNIPIPLHDLKRILSEQFRQVRNSTRRNTGNKNNLRTIAADYLGNQSNHRNEVTLCRLFLGHIYLTHKHLLNHLNHQSHPFVFPATLLWPFLTYSFIVNFMLLTIRPFEYNLLYHNF